MKRVFLIDGNSLANRAYYAMPYLTNSQKKPSGAVYGFANLLIKLILEEQPDEIVIAFDHARQTFRNTLYAEYKGNRVAMPDDFKEQMPVIKEMLNIMQIKTIEKEGIEADDIIGTLSKFYDDSMVYIITGDRDLFQLIRSNVNVWLTRKGLSEIQRLTKYNLNYEFGYTPAQVTDLKALMGDSSDNIPGVSGVGEKTALKLLESYYDLDNIYRNIDKISGKLCEKLKNGKEMAYLSKQLATIKTDCTFNFDGGAYPFPFSQEVYDFFKKWSFSSLLNRPNLFAGQIEEKPSMEFKQATKIQLRTIDDVNDLIKKINGEFSYDLEKMEFSANEDEIYYVERVLDMFSRSLDPDKVLEALKPIFEDKNITKITQNAKKDLKILKEKSITLNNFFDLEIANYLLYAGLTVKKENYEINSYFALKKIALNKLKEDGLTDLYFNMELPLVNVLFNMEEEGFLIDEKSLDVLKEEYDQKIALLTKQITALAGEEFNINSPKQVANILFNKLKLKAYNNKKQSTSSDILSEIIDQHEIVEKILEYRKTNKVLNTYIDVYKKICAEKGSVIHTVFNQTQTSTGRLSSAEPNLQNIPTKDDQGRNIRKLFISKFEGGKIMSADYNQIELRLLADMSGEEELIRAYRSGEDIHALTASLVFHVPIENVTPELRRQAKAVNFGIIYGISDFGLAQSIKTSKKRAKDYIDAYFLKYKKVKEFSEQNVEYARKNGFIKTKFGRIRHIPEIQSSNHNIRSFAERVAMNMPLQGTASDIIKLAMIEVFNSLKNLKSRLILQIHDELIVDVYPGEEEEVKNILVSKMENVTKLLVPLPVSVGVGKNLYECK